MTAARAYTRTQNETASRERLMVLLFEAALRHMRTAAKAFDQKRNAEAIAATSKASAIVTELLNTLHHDTAPALCSDLQSLYVFVLNRLLLGMTSRTSKPIQEAVRVFEPIVTGFAEAVKTIERQGAQAPR